MLIMSEASRSQLMPPSTGDYKKPTDGTSKSSSGGSATGNPRNKCALKPGHSLVHWIRLTNSGVDLARTGGAVVPVNFEELAKHNRREDAWLALWGKVYNVTPYMDYHPGGVDELMRGIGRDATELFNEVHGWVNYQQLLSKCFIGPLQRKRTPRIASTLAPPQSALPSSSEGSSIVDAHEKKPRFDWTQTRTAVALFFSTQPFSNAGALVRLKASNILQVLVLTEEPRTYLHNYELHGDVLWPPALALATAGAKSEAGKIELSLKKADARLWPELATSTTATTSPSCDAIKCDYEVFAKRMFNHDSFELTLRPRDRVCLLPPVGSHVSFHARPNDANISREYTPVPVTLLKLAANRPHDDDDPSHLHFLIKSYPDGIFAQFLRECDHGTIVQLSMPRRSLRLRTLQAHSRFALLAAGSGLTPMLSLIEHLLHRTANRIERVTVMLFNRTEADVWCRDILDNLQAKDERLQIEHILSEPDVTWSGRSGRVCSSLLAPLSDNSAVEWSTYVCVCGPPPFVQSTTDALHTIDFAASNVHIF